ncbi:MAG TPA: cyclic nucleotide-binding domain-containing protein [Acidimicrobiia bacterium]|nr:cyclic nucleotide-binding domain-containing protein [Acidimicrobiia bacterium]
MAIAFAQATTADEIEAVQRLRHRVYVEELGRYADVSEHGIFAEPEDATSWLFYAHDDGNVVACTRLTWGGDGFSKRQIDQYRLEPFLADVPHEMIAVGERASVLPDHRGTGLLDELMHFAREATSQYGIRVVFGCCEPHLLTLYLKMGCITYADRNINSSSAGYLIPIISFTPNSDALRGVTPGMAPDALPKSVEHALSEHSAVRSQTLTMPDEYWSGIRRTLDELHDRRVGAFDGFTDDEARRCIERSNIIECAAGDRVLKRGGSAHNIFVVLRGTLEVRSGDQIVGVLSAGDTFGEMAFLLQNPRAFDVDAASDAEVLSLSEGALRKMISDDAVVAAKLLLNVSKMLCWRLIRAESVDT